MELYDVWLVGNDDFEDWTKDDWEESPLYDPLAEEPEWDEYTAEIWRYGDQFYEPEDFE